MKGTPRALILMMAVSVLVAANAIASWSLQTVDGTAGSGFYSSLAFHPSTGFPSIAYSAPGSRNQQALKLAQWNGASWEIQTASTEKSVENVCLVFDASGNPAIAFSHTQGGLKLARRSGSTWSVETIDSRGAGVPSLVYHGGQFWVAYPTNSSLKVAHSVGWSWVAETIDGSGMSYVSLAFAPDGNPSVAYRFGVTDATLRFAHKNGFAWSVQDVETGHYYGIFASLAYDPLTGYPTIAHAIGGPIRFVRWDGSGWIAENATTSSSSTQESLAFDAGGIASISYSLAVDTSGYKQLHLARRNGCSGTCWNDELVVDEAPQQVQWRTSLAFAPTGAATISYGVVYPQTLKIAQELP